jgi:type IV pilus assembly protein PilA
MRNLNNKSGFTLIEIIVVMIIVGILAAIALPNLFSNVGKSKGVQALVLLDGCKTAMESYYVLHSGNTPVNTDLAAAGAVTTATVSGTTFTVTIPAATAAQSATSGATTIPSGTYAGSNLIFTLSASDGATSITLTRQTTGSWTCSAPTAGSYVGLC